MILYCESSADTPEQRKLAENLLRQEGVIGDIRHEWADGILRSEGETSPDKEYV